MGFDGTQGDNGINSLQPITIEKTCSLLGLLEYPSDCSDSDSDSDSIPSNCQKTQ